MTTTTREIHLAARPSGWPTPEDFRLVEVELPDPAPGEVLVRNTFMSVDPYMRGRMNDVKSYVPPFRLDAPLDGGAVGEVVASGDESVPRRRHRAAPGRAGASTRCCPPARCAWSTSERVPASAYLGVLGMPGLTAYVGLTRIAELQEGDAVLVSGAAGAVGSARRPAGPAARRVAGSSAPRARPRRWPG